MILVVYRYKQDIPENSALHLDECMKKLTVMLVVTKRLMDKLQGTVGNEHRLYDDYYQNDSLELILGRRLGDRALVMP